MSRVEHLNGGVIGDGHDEGSRDADSNRTMDRVGADAGSEEDETLTLFQPEWPEVTYHTTDFKQAGMSIVGTRVQSPHPCWYSCQ